jgi:hypothetical protein
MEEENKKKEKEKGGIWIPAGCCSTWAGRGKTKE